MRGTCIIGKHENTITIITGRIVHMYCPQMGHECLAFNPFIPVAVKSAVFMFLSEFCAPFKVNFDMLHDCSVPKFYKIVEHEQPGTGFWPMNPISIWHQRFAGRNTIWTHIVKGDLGRGGGGGYDNHWAFIHSVYSPK